jgi:hypothetical protein
LHRNCFSLPLDVSDCKTFKTIGQLIYITNYNLFVCRAMVHRVLTHKLKVVLTHKLKVENDTAETGNDTAVDIPTTGKY